MGRIQLRTMLDPFKWTAGLHKESLETMLYTIALLFEHFSRIRSLDLSIYFWVFCVKKWTIAESLEKAIRFSIITNYHSNHMFWSCLQADIIELIVKDGLIDIDWRTFRGQYSRTMYTLCSSLKKCWKRTTCLCDNGSWISISRYSWKS